MTTKFDRTFLQMEQAGGEREKNPPKRWHLSSVQLADYSLRAMLELGDEIQDWPYVEFHDLDRSVDFPEVIEDMPWSWPYVPQVVSTRLRGFIEQIAPGEAQFLPIIVRQKCGKVFKQGEYWCVHWLRVIDCIDWDKSRFVTITNDQGKQYRQFGFMGMVINPTKIDSTVKFCRPLWKSSNVVLVRGSVAKSMKSHKFSGPQFDYIPLSTDPAQELHKFAKPFSALKDWKELS